MRILIITDAWYPQINGVVRTLDSVAAELRRTGSEVHFITPQERHSFSFPLYPEIRLAFMSSRRMATEISAIKPDAVHIATEGPLGWAARRACLNMSLPFTTGFHTMFADYAQKRTRLPGTAALVWQVLRYFHRPSAAVLVPTPTIGRQLERRGFVNISNWTRGVDRKLFHARHEAGLPYARPIMVYAGRLAIEKGIEDFLALDLPGSKVLLGDGPMRKALEKRFPDAHFLGFRTGESYAQVLAAADVMVFPSRTDTFGLVMIEAMACGTPVAAYDVASPVDVVVEGVTGAMNHDLAEAARQALKLDRAGVEDGSRSFTWAEAAHQFFVALVPVAPGTWEKGLADTGPLPHL